MIALKIGHFAKLLALLIVAMPTSAHAVCVILTAPSASPLTASTGTYTAPTPPTAVSISLSLQISFIALLGGQCNGAISFNRGSLPASMAIVGGGGAAPLPYSIGTSATGGNSLLYTGGGTPDTANRLNFSFTAPPLAVPNTMTVNLTIFFLAQPNTPQQGGSYSDTISLDVFGQALQLIPTNAGSFSFTVTGFVTKACTIGGVDRPAVDTATIPITTAGAVSTAPIVKSYANTFCNTPAFVQLTSQNGAVRTAGSAVPGFAQSIDYSASASFSGAEAALDTATIPTATGIESGMAVSTIGSIPSGTMAVTISPQANSMPLVKGSYSDTLTITITPQ